MKKQNKISIIVPVYNSKKTIQRCVDSLLNQDYKNIEIVLVDDGSLDNSLKIIKKYAKQNTNIKVFSQKNGGAGKARNKGIKEATGDYITFVDSDDELRSNAISNMVKCLKSDTDIVIGGFKEYDTGGNVLIDMKPKGNYWDEFKFTSTMFKLYKRDFITNNKIKFAHFQVFEDLYFCLSAYSKTDNIEKNQNQDYVIYKNSESITSNFSSRPTQDCLDVLKEINAIGLEKYKEKTLEFFYLKTLILNIVVQLDGHSSKELNEIYLNDYKYLKSLKLCGNKVKYHYEKFESFSINLVVNIFLLFTKLHMTKILITFLQKCKKIRVK